MAKHDYSEIKKEILILSATLSQRATTPVEFKTGLAKFLYSIRDQIRESKYDVFVILTHIIQILDVIPKRGGFLRFWKIGKIVWKAIVALRGQKRYYTRVNKYFVVEEFVDPKMIKEYGPNGAMAFMSNEIINIVTYIRESTGRAVIINNWSWGGKLSQRGFRASWSNIGRKSSAHRTGEGVDFNIFGWSTEQTHDFLLQHESELISLGLRRVEMAKYTPTWTHVDTKETGKDKIYFFAP